MRLRLRKRESRFYLAILALLLIACGSTSQSVLPEVTGADGRAELRERMADVAATDVAGDPGDSSPETSSPPDDIWQLADTLVPDTPFEVVSPADLLEELTPQDVVDSEPLGVVSGSCGELAATFAAELPALLINTYLFNEAGNFDSSLLGKGAKKRYDQDNQGGSSLCSEVMSIQLLEECDGALLHKTETEIEYALEGSITDYISMLDGKRIGVSVTRAYKGPMGDDYTLEDATTLLTKKLDGLHDAAANVAAEDVWDHSMLHVWTLRADWVPTLTEAWEALSTETKGAVIVMVTIEENSMWIVPESCKP